jgi:hypothetical protein
MKPSYVIAFGGLIFLALIMFGESAATRCEDRGGKVIRSALGEFDGCITQ